MIIIIIIVFHLYFTGCCSCEEILAQTGPAKFDAGLPDNLPLNCLTEVARFSPAQALSQGGGGGGGLGLQDLPLRDL